MDLFELAATLTLDSSQYESGINDAKEKADSFGVSLETAAKVGAGAFAAVGTAIVGVGAGIVKSTGDIASYGDNIDKASQKMGISAKAYQEWDAVLQHSGTSIDSLKRGMTTLSKQASEGAEEFEKLGISQDQLANMSQEELFGAVIEGLQKMESGTERTVTAQKLLGGSAKELGALLNTSAEDTQKMKDRVNELGGVMSDDAVKAAARYQDSLQDMQTAFSGISRNIMSDFLPSMATVMDGLTEIFGGDSDKGIALVTQGVSGVLTNLEESIPKFMEIGSSVMAAISDAIMANFPSIVENGTQIVINLAVGIANKIPDLLLMAGQMMTVIIKTIASNIPRLLEYGGSLISNFNNGIGKKIPDIIKSIGDMLSNLISTIMQKAPDFIRRGVEIIGQLITGIGQNLPAIISSIASVLAKVIATIAQNLPQFLQKGIEIIGQIVSGIIRAVPTLLAEIPKIVANAASKFTQYDWKNIGKNIINGVAKGITKAGGVIVDAAKNAASNAFEAAKKFLGIASPSKLFRDKIGKMISAGMAVGIDSNGNLIVKATEKALDAKKAVKKAKDTAKAVQTELKKINNAATEGGFSKKKKWVAEAVPLTEIQAAVDDMAEAIAVEADPAEVVDVKSSVEDKGADQQNGAKYGTFAPVINVYAKDQDVNELAELIMERLTFMYDRERVAYGMA